MKVIAIIPARYASTRFPGKPLVVIDGKPMIQHVYERVVTKFTNCYVATDDTRIVDAVEKFGGRTIMTSPDHKSGTDRCAQALDRIETLEQTKYDVVVNIQGDEPFISTKQLEELMVAFENPQTQIATLAKRFTGQESVDNPNLPKVVLTVDGFALYFSRSVIPYIRDKDAQSERGEFPYLKHIGLYAYRSAVLREIAELPQSRLELSESLEQLRWLENGYRIKVEQTAIETIAIDTPADLERVKDMMKNSKIK